MSKGWYVGCYLIILFALGMSCMLIYTKPPQINWLSAIIVLLPTLFWVPANLYMLAKEGWWPK